MISGSAPQSEASYGKVLCIPKKDLRPLGKKYKWAPLCHWPKISPIKEIESRLKDLQLLHFTNVGHTNLDQSLLRAMARFWRPETHSFHFPVGEMTVTLEDVAFLFGLPTTGKVATSPMKVDPKKLVLQFLAKKDPVTKSPLADSIAGAFTETKDGLAYYVRISWLRKQCKNGLGMNATEEEKDRFTRLYCLLLFGTSLFPSSTKGAVPAFLLELLEGDLNERKDYNWGAAVLAYLYHALDCAAMNIPKKNIPGPWLLLQLWSWTRFPTCRPEMISLLDLSKESVPYGRKWMGKRKYNFPHRSGICYAREVFLKLGENNIEWRPYEKVFQYMPQLVQATPADCFRTTLPCIFYWKVAIYYPNRVMRQFGLYQKIPEVPMNSEEMKTYFEQKRTASTGLTTLHKDFCKRWLEMKEGDKVDETRPWTSDNMSDYLRWYRLCCGGKIIVPGHVTNKPASQQHYIHQADVSMAHVKNDLKLAIYGIKLVEDGLPNVGKAILRLAESNLDLEPASKCKLEHLLQARGLSSDFEEIEDETSSPTDILPDAFEAIISKGGNIKFDMLEKYLGPPTQIARVLLNRVPNELGPADSNHQFVEQKQAPYHAPGYQQEQPPHNALRRASPKDSYATSSEEDTDAMEEISEPQLEQTPNYRRASPDDNNASGPVQKEFRLIST
ncbi:hypothetical protein LUZ62_052964 [Rhynchospora pubera]|uniref:Aminotransferase-like plant mobile domain-containing protein n=1 Tax=Rhynchospora pubera TaxID=906938 RepID=A0AAV8G7Q1_9POAL|nr:hypothetical protein LUZ62_052964 [Rhynchospora pubera]